MIVWKPLPASQARKRTYSNVWGYYESTRDLPEGHYDKKKAERLMEKEYAKCSELNKVLRKKFKYANRYLNIEEAREIMVHLSKSFGGKRPIIYVSKGMISGGRFNAPNIISFPIRTLSASTVYHEMAHFMCFALRLYDSHSSTDFLTCFELMWEEANKFYKDKHERSSFPFHGIQTTLGGVNGVANSSRDCVPGVPSLWALNKQA